MKKITLLVCSQLVLFASVGKFSAVVGEVKVTRDSKEILANTGDSVEEKDIIKTENKSKAQITFNDETVVTVGRDSEFKVEEYNFSGADSTTKLKASKGFFKAITGQIGKVAPDKFQLETKTATIGIRGTQFMANISDSDEVIACTKGAITVLAQGKMIDVLAGEMTKFNIGEIPGSPVKFTPRDLTSIKSGSFGVDSKLAQKIDSVKLNKDTLKPDSEKLAEVLKDIANIKDNDKKIAALDRLEDSLNSQIDDLLGENSVAVPFSKYPSSFYESVKGGYYLENPIKEENGKYVVGDKSFSELNDAILAAKAIELWREGSETPAENVASVMNYNSATDTFPSHWDGTQKNKKVYEYSGSSVGYVTNQLDKSQSVIQNDGTNKTTMLIDFGSRLIIGGVAFDAQNPTTKENDQWRLNFGSVGSKIITATSFVSTDLFQGKGANTNLVDAALFFNRYFGENLEQVSGFFELVSNDVDPTDYSHDKVAYGVYSLNKTAEHTLTPKEVGKDEYFSWGYWSDDTLTIGAWITPNLAQTKEEIIKEFAQNGSKANYQGGAYGTVHYAKDGLTSTTIENGKVNLDVDFAKATVNGDVTFNTKNEDWKVNVNDGLVEANKFQSSTVSGALSDGDKIYSGEVAGQFYGDKAQAVGGGFNITTQDGKSAIGAFGATTK